LEEIVPPAPTTVNTSSNEIYSKETPVTKTSQTGKYLGKFITTGYCDSTPDKLKKTASGKVDKRTTEYKEMVERAKKARLAAKKQKEKEKEKAGKKSATSGLKRKANGKIDLRTKEGKEVAKRMEKARKARDKKKGVVGKLLSLLK